MVFTGYTMEPEPAPRLIFHVILAALHGRELLG